MKSAWNSIATSKSPRHHAVLVELGLELLVLGASTPIRRHWSIE